MSFLFVFCELVYYICGMKVNINIEKSVLDVWQKEVIVSTITAKDCSLSYNALKKAINTGLCSQSTAKKIDSYILKNRKKRVC